MNLLKTFLLTSISLLIAITSCETKKDPASKPNILFFLIDDMGWKDLGCYGSTFYDTPNIDAFAEESLLFTNAYAPAPVCSPTRASILSGKYPARLHLTEWTGPEEWHIYGKLKTPDFKQHLELDEITMAESFKKKGYTTCFLGKWHVGAGKYYPQYQGFDTTIGVSEAGGPPSYFYPYYNRGYEGTGWPPQIEDLAESGEEGEYLTERLTDEALNYLDTVNEPFLMYFAHFAVHRPLQAKENMIEKYKQKANSLPSLDSSSYYIDENGAYTKSRQDHPVFASMVESVDISFGRLLDKLEEKGLLKNTIVVFTSDNGGLATTRDGSDIELSTSVLPLRTGKGWLYEGGIRVPMIIGWEGKIKPGTRSSALISGMDMYPTLLNLAGMDPIPDQHVDAIDQSRLIFSANATSDEPLNPPRNTLYFHYPHYHASGMPPASAVIHENYKLIHWYEGNYYELFDLKEDIGETNDLSEELPTLTKKLSDMLDKHLKETNAQMVQ